MNSWPMVDVVIPCYNVEHIVYKCVDSVVNQEYNNQFNIYLVNDGSTDKTLHILNTFLSLDNVYIINNYNNRGLSAVRNHGVGLGSSEIICFLDSDMIVNKNWIRSHVEILMDKNVVGVVGNNILPKGKNPNRLDKYLYDKRRGAQQFNEQVPIKFPYFLFSNTSIKRYVFDRIDMFDENINSYGGEDTDLAIRLWEQFPDGLRFSNNAISQHCSNKTMKDFQNAMYDYGEKNLFFLLKKHPKYKKDLGGQYIYSIKGYIIFNPIIRLMTLLIDRVIDNYWVKRYLVVDAVIRGGRNTSI